MASFAIASVLVASYFCCVQGQSSCSTPGGADGSCTSIHDCSALMAIVTKPNKSQQDIQLLKMSHCGFDTDVPKVCCPVQTQNNHRPCTMMTAEPPDPGTQCCGIESWSGDKIIGGTATYVDQYPWLALIEYVKDHTVSLACGGTLISGRYVLTAGHCAVGKILDSGNPTNVRLGEYDTSNDGRDCMEVPAGGVDCTEGLTVIPIEEVIPHPQYDPSASHRRNDIALMRLGQLAPYTDFIRPICLPTTDVTLSPRLGVPLHAAGWGAVSPTVLKSDIKLKVTLPFVPMAECQPVYSLPKRNVTLWQGQLCAGGEGGKDSCKGDSGGPLMYENDKHFDIVGITSFGPSPCGMKDTPAVYTKVFEYNSWIRSQIKS